MDLVVRDVHFLVGLLFVALLVIDIFFDERAGLRVVVPEVVVFLTDQRTDVRVRGLGVEVFLFERQGITFNDLVELLTRLVDSLNATGWIIK